MKIYVGTANWGKPYGMNQVRVPTDEIHHILDVAYANNCGIETAWDYDCMGVLRGLSHQFDVIYKYDTTAELKEGRGVLGPDLLHMKHHCSARDKTFYPRKSVYSPDEVTGLEYVVECPYNIIDQRFAWDFYYTAYNRSQNKKWIARSVFIQGLAFKMPDFHGIPFYHLCWNFVRNNPNIDGIVVGVDTAEQLEDILSIPQYEIDYSKIGGEGWFRTL